MISCEEKLSEIEQELYNKVVGRWEIVSVHTRGFWGDELLYDDYFYISDSILSPNSERAMHYKDNGEIVVECSFEGITSMEDYFATWMPEDNDIKFNHCLFPNVIETTVYKLTETEFHYKIYFEWQSDRLMSEMYEYELKR